VDYIDVEVSGSATIPAATLLDDLLGTLLVDGFQDRASVDGEKTEDETQLRADVVFDVDITVPGCRVPLSVETSISPRPRRGPADRSPCR